MDNSPFDYEKFAIEYSEKVISDAEKERRKEDRYQNRFNYYNCAISTIALMLSIIAIILGVN